MYCHQGIRASCQTVSTLSSAFSLVSDPGNRLVIRYTSEIFIIQATKISEISAPGVFQISHRIASRVELCEVTTSLSELLDGKPIDGLSPEWLIWANRNPASVYFPT